jgi:hypothetical protein
MTNADKVNEIYITIGAAHASYVALHDCVKRMIEIAKSENDKQAQRELAEVARMMISAKREIKAQLPTIEEYLGIEPEN